MKFLKWALLSLVLAVSGAQAQLIGAAFTAVSLQSSTPANVGANGGFEAHPPTWQITATRPTISEIEIQMRGPADTFYWISFAAPLDGVLSPGAYEEAHQSALRRASPGLELRGATPCIITRGWFVIHELAYNSDGTLARFAASFEQRCPSGASILGEVRYNSPVPLPSMVVGPDTSADPFAFTPQVARAGTVVYSNRVSVRGVNSPVWVTVWGGAFTVNGVSSPSMSQYVNPGDEIVVSVRSSRAPGGVRRVEVTIGGRQAIFEVRTYQPGEFLSGLYFQSPTGEFIGQGQTKLYLAPPNGFSMSRNSVNGIDAAVRAMHGSWWMLHLAAGGNGAVLPGMYWFRRGTNPAEPDLSFGGDGNGCDADGHFLVHEADYGPDGAPTRFSADFEHRCEGSGLPLSGEVRLNSAIPFSALTGGACAVSEPECVADLAITQAFSGIDNPAGEFTISLRATNNGPGPAQNLTVTNRLPAGATFARASDNCTLVSGTVTCTRPVLQPGTMVQYDIVIRPGPGNSIVNTATVRAEEIDQFPANDTSTVDALVRTPPLSNISTRGQVMSGGSEVLIGGFVIGGSASKTVVVRARGPSLAAFGITNALANPLLELYRSSDQALIASNNNWGAADNAAALGASGFAPSNPLEAAILINLPPGAYTAIVSGILATGGVAIVEVFEVDHPEVPLANISTRGQVLTGNDVLIGGFVVQGGTPRTVVVRARGPSLAPFGITQPLTNPTLVLVRSSDQTVVASNDDWATAPNSAALLASGFAPPDGSESAILVTLSPGAYTAIVSGVGGVTGIGIVEVFPLP